mmetsp:Transcript_6801/g.16929  ORF Transcript_6801/g.16929 Transcript_6801/m.16929 type:complete len:857 (-) Transcript_6801:133-2703(-)
MPPKVAPKAKAKEDLPENEKKRKVEGESGPRKEAKKEETVEQEIDAPADGRPVLEDRIAFETSDTTLNVVPALGGKVLMALSDGGMQYLIAGARANVAVIGGRYLYEVKIVEQLAALELSAGVPMRRGPWPLPKQFVRLGFSAAGSDLVLCDGEGSVSFDSEGAYFSDGDRTIGGQRFGADQVVAVLLNLDQHSPNANTVSLFCDGVRVSEPRRLPEGLVGKPLFPHVSYRNVSVQVNFGPTLLAELPFRCRCLQLAARADVSVTPAEMPKDGRYEVLLPVALPDEGGFDWADEFLSRNSHFVELSDRKIFEWATKSGLQKPANRPNKEGNHSNDRPEFAFGAPAFDDLGVRQIIDSIASITPRHYLVMQVCANLLAESREETLKRFPAEHYKLRAAVLIGEPSDEFRLLQRNLVLKAKQDSAQQEWKARKAEKIKKKQQEKRAKEMAEVRRQADERRKKAAEEAKKKKKTEEAKADVKEEDKKGEVKVEGKEEVKEEIKEEVKEDIKMEVKEEAEAEEEEENDEPPPVVELTEEERQTKFRPIAVKDLSLSVFSSCFSKFTVPQMSEGFEKISFEWSDEVESTTYLNDWLRKHRLTCRIEDLQPSKKFFEKFASWQKVIKEWQAKQKVAKEAEQKERAAKEAEMKDDDEDVIVEEQNKDDVDISTVEDVTNTGDGVPLFKEFCFEDWVLLQLRAELYLLVKSFLQDCGDADRKGVPFRDFEFYYQKYYSRTLVPKAFAHESLLDLIATLSDTVVVNAHADEQKLLESVINEDVETLDVFVKLAEEQRRERQRRIEAGDETATLNFFPNCMTNRIAPKAQVAAPKVANNSWTANQTWANVIHQWSRQAWGPVWGSW